MNPITIPNISIPTIGIPTIGIPSVGFPSASGGGGLSWPAGMKEHIKAWYDPKKQGITNFDVIEAYTEDFTTWTVNKEAVIANVTSKSITITNVLNSNPLIYAYDTFSVRLRIDGLKNGQGIFFGDNKEYTISENGIYDIDTTENIRTNFIGECNITITQLPTSILKDLSGNGNHAYLYGGKGKLNSGMGLYKVDFTSWRFYPSFNTVEYYHNKLVIKKAPDSKNLCAHIFTDKFTAKISNIPDGTNLYYRYYDRINKKNVSILLHNGINEIDYTNADGSIDATNMFIISKDVDFNITIEQIPDYPDQLCYDGKMYAVCYGFPILTDYTVMAERTWFENKGSYAFISKRAIGNIRGNAFVFEKDDNTGTPNSLRVYSFDADSIIMPNKNNSISYQTKTKYNNQNIRYGSGKDSGILMIGAGLYRSEQNLITELWNGCHGVIIIADRSFTEEEINWLKQNWDKI